MNTQQFGALLSFIFLIATFFLESLFIATTSILLMIMAVGAELKENIKER